MQLVQSLQTVLLKSVLGVVTAATIRKETLVLSIVHLKQRQQGVLMELKVVQMAVAAPQLVAKLAHCQIALVLQLSLPTVHIQQNLVQIVTAQKLLIADGLVTRDTHNRVAVASINVK